jgi:integrase
MLTELKLAASADPWMLYLYAMRSPATKQKYLMRLRRFLSFLNLQGVLEDKARIFAEKGKNDSIWAFNSILEFLQVQIERFNRKEITAGTIRNYVKSIKLFCQMADVYIPWDKITRGLPKGRRYADDRAPTLEEIKKLCDYPDRRIKPLVYIMVSSGIRVGAWDYLHWGNIRPIQQNGKIVAARMVVYAGEEDDSYLAFMTPLAYRELSEWMKYRSESGEIITDDSWVMRDLWDTQAKVSKGLVTIPKQLTSIGVKRLMERAIWAQGLRKKLEVGKKRHPFPTNHSLRKYFKTRCELAGMKPINIESMMGHSTGISDSYYRPTENDLLQDYLRCADALTVQNEESVLQKQVEDLREKSKDNEYVVNAQLQEKDSELQILKKQIHSLEQAQIETQKQLEELLKHHHKVIARSMRRP